MLFNHQNGISRISPEKTKLEYQKKKKKTRC